MSATLTPSPTTAADPSAPGSGTPLRTTELGPTATPRGAPGR